MYNKVVLDIYVRSMLNAYTCVKSFTSINFAVLRCTTMHYKALCCVSVC